MVPARNPPQDVADDMRVSVYEADSYDVEEGYRQLIFKRDKAQLLYCLDPVYFSRIPTSQLQVPNTPEKKKVWKIQKDFSNIELLGIIYA